MSPCLAVIAILLLLGLLCCVVLTVFLTGGRGLGRGEISLDAPNRGLHLVNQLDVVVVADNAGLRVVERVPDCGRTQADLAQVGGFDAEYALGYRQREEGHAE